MAEAPRTAQPICSTMPLAVSIASLTRITVTAGKAATTALRKASSSSVVPPSG